MKISCSRKKIADGVHFTEIINPSQKSNLMLINLVTELSAETASLNSIIPYVISDSSREYKTMTELSRKLSSLYGSMIRGGVTKLGDSQVISLSASCINDRYTIDGERITEEAARVLVGCLTDPYTENGGFYAADFALKKQELLDDIDAEINEKRSYAIKRSSLTVYKDEPCAVPIKGTKETAGALTPEAAYRQYKKLLAEAQIEIYFVGACPSEEAEKIICGAVLGTERAYAGDNSSALSLPKAEPERIAESLDVAQCKMVMAFKSPMTDYAAVRLMSAIFGATPFSKLFMNVREKLSLCYYCQSGYNRNKGVMIVDSGVERCNVEKAEAEILNQLEAVKNGDFTDEDIENSRLSVINRIKGVNDGTYSLAEWYFNQSYLGTDFSPEDEIQHVREVTREKIIEAAKSFTLDTVYVLTGKEADDN